MIRLARATDAEQVHAIYAPIVRDTAISFESEVPSAGEMARRIEVVLGFRPWLVLEEAGELLGYAYASVFRERAAYQWGTEVSVYVRADVTGRGIGGTLYGALFDVLRLQGFCTAVAGATLPNEATERLHRRMGFSEIGRYPAAGFKFGRWHDVIFWYLRLRELPLQPRPLTAISDLIATKEWNHALEKQTPRL